MTALAATAAAIALAAALAATCFAIAGLIILNARQHRRTTARS